MSRSQLALNLVTVGLLALVAAGFGLMPRHNYAVIATRLASLEIKTAALEGGFEKLNILAGPDEEKRAAVVGNIDSIGKNLKKLDTDLVSFMENLAAQSSSVDDLSRRLKVVEETRLKRADDGSPGGTDEVACAKPARLDGDVSAKVAKLSPMKLAQMDFDEFLKLAVERGLTAPLRPAPGEEALVEGKRSSLKHLFDSYRACIETIKESEQLLIQTLVERATRSGTYVEEEEAGERRNVVRALSGGGTVFVKSLGPGRRRVFRFTVEEHPELLHFEDLRESALKSLVISLSAISGL